MRFTRMLCGVFALGMMAVSASAGPVDLIVDAWAIYDSGQPTESWVQIRDGGDPTDAGTCANPLLVPPALLPDLIWFGVAVKTDGSLGLGTATVVYDVVPCTGAYVEPGFTMDQMHDVPTGWPASWCSPPTLAWVSNPYYGYVCSGYAYAGGWGHDSGGLYHEGTTDGGSILGPQLAAPLKYTADVNSYDPGLQPNFKNDVGLGTWYLEGPYGTGHVGGFGMDIYNRHNIINGDGHWMFQQSTIDLSSWECTDGAVYGWQLVLRQAAVMNATLDYNVDHDGGFRVNVPGIPEEGLVQDSFAFIPDCPGCRCGDIDDSGGPVDLADFGLFALCYGSAAPTGSCTAAYFECSDLDGSGLVDLTDFGLFALWYGQTSSRYPPSCQP